MNTGVTPSDLDFDALLTPGAWIALRPLLALTLGILAVLTAEVVDALRPFRGAILLATLAVTAFFQVQILGGPEALASTDGLVLGGALVADGVSAVWGLVFLGATGLAWALGSGYYDGAEARFQDEHDVLVLTCPLGMTIMAGAQDMVVFFLGLELLSIPLYVLAAYQRSRSKSVEAGLKYFLLGAFASALFVYGAALLYTETGTLSLVSMAAEFDPATAGPLALTGVGLIAASLLFKISVFPFHLWVPDVYQGSPTPVTALMAAGTKAAAMAFLLNALFLLPPGTAPLIAALGVLTMAVGYLAALVQEDLKRMLAYSGVASAGTVILVVAGALAEPELLGEARVAALYYIGAYAFAIIGAFGTVALLERDGERFTRLSNLAGLARSRPGLAAALSLFVLSLGGIPATGGFLGKWFVFAVLVRADMPVMAVLGVLCSVIALGFYLAVIVKMWMVEPEGDAPVERGTMLSRTTMVLCVAGVLLTGLLPNLFLP